MFDVGMPELIVIFIVALLVLGPKNLPAVAKALGKGLGELKKAFQDIKDEVETEFKETTSEIRETVTDVKKQIEADVKETTKTIDSSLKDVKEELEADSQEIKKTFDDALKESEQPSNEKKG